MAESQIVDHQTPKSVSLQQCERCGIDIGYKCHIKSHSLFEKPSESDNTTITSISCARCNQVCVVNLGGEDDSTWMKLDDTLYDGNKKDGFTEVKTEKDRIVLYILNQIISAQDDELDVDLKFMPTPAHECAKILWHDQRAVGFYTWKPCGSYFSQCLPYSYDLPVIDLMFIHPKYRRRGLGTKMLLDIVNSFPGSDIGFSQKISETMLRVLEKFLHQASNMKYRLKMWEVAHVGDEGNRRLIWYILKRGAAAFVAK